MRIRAATASQHFPELGGITPRPEPDSNDYEAWLEWTKEYQQWSQVRCPCGTGYFCRKHGEWISGADIKSGDALPQDQEQKHYHDCCPPRHRTDPSAQNSGSRAVRKHQSIQRMSKCLCSEPCEPSEEGRPQPSPGDSKRRTSLKDAERHRSRNKAGTRVSSSQQNDRGNRTDLSVGSIPSPGPSSYYSGTHSSSATTYTDPPGSSDYEGYYQTYSMPDFVSSEASPRKPLPESDYLPPQQQYSSVASDDNRQTFSAPEYSSQGGYSQQQQDPEYWYRGIQRSAKEDIEYGARAPAEDLSGELEQLSLASVDDQALHYDESHDGAPGPRQGDLEYDYSTSSDGTNIYRYRTVIVQPSTTGGSSEPVPKWSEWSDWIVTPEQPSPKDGKKRKSKGKHRH